MRDRAHCQHILDCSTIAESVPNAIAFVVIVGAEHKSDGRTQTDMVCWRHNAMAEYTIRSGASTRLSKECQKIDPNPEVDSRQMTQPGTPSNPHYRALHGWRDIRLIRVAQHSRPTVSTKSHFEI